jgi:integrase
MRRRGQRGSLVNRNGVWTGMWREYAALPDGNQQSKLKAKAFPGMSERAAWSSFQPILDAANRSNIAPMLVKKADPTLQDAINEWRRIVAVNMKPRGLETAESHLRAHIVPRLGTTNVADLDLKTMQDFVAGITPGHSGKYVENILLTLSGILRHVRKWGWKVPVFELADLSMPKKVKAKPRYYEVEEIKRLLAAAQEPLKTILMVLVTTGLRINECLALRIEDLDFDRDIISVEHSAYNGTLGTPKSEASVADLNMSPQLKKALQDFIDGKHFRKNKMGLLFCNRRMRPYSDNKLREKQLRPLLRKLKMYSSGRVFHAIRHSVGSIMLESGSSILNVQKQLRHSNASVTLNVYGHVLGDSQRKASNDLSARFIA